MAESLDLADWIVGEVRRLVSLGKRQIATSDFVQAIIGQTPTVLDESTTWWTYWGTRKAHITDDDGLSAYSPTDLLAALARNGDLLRHEDAVKLVQEGPTYGTTTSSLTVEGRAATLSQTAPTSASPPRFKSQACTDAPKKPISPKARGLRASLKRG